MPCRQKFRAEGEGVIEHEIPADGAVADQARIRRHALGATIQEILHDSGSEDFLCIHHVKGNIEFGCHTPRLSHGIGCAAAVGILPARLRPQAQHHPDDLVALLLEQSRGNGTIYTTRHSNDDFIRVHLFLSVFICFYLWLIFSPFPPKAARFSRRHPHRQALCQRPA